MKTSQINYNNMNYRDLEDRFLIRKVTMEPLVFLNRCYFENMNSFRELYEKSLKNKNKILIERSKKDWYWFKKLTFKDYLNSVMIYKPAVEDIKKMILQGKRKIPMLYLKFNKDGKQIGHDGRHRAFALYELGVTKLIVLILKQK